MQLFKVINSSLQIVEKDHPQLAFGDPIEAVVCHIMAERAELAVKHRRLVEQAEMNFPGLFRAADVDRRIGQMIGGVR